MFVPHGPYLFVSRKFATGGGGLRGRDSVAFFRRKRHRRCVIICSGEAENNAGDVALSVRRKITRDFNCSVEKLCHSLIVTPLCLKTTTKYKAFYDNARRGPAADLKQVGHVLAALAVLGRIAADQSLRFSTCTYLIFEQNLLKISMANLSDRAAASGTGRAPRRIELLLA